MAIKIIRCPSCGENMNVDTEKPFVFCGRCGAKLMRRNPAPAVDQPAPAPMQGATPSVQNTARPTPGMVPPEQNRVRPMPPMQNAVPAPAKKKNGVKIAAVCFSVIAMLLAVVVALQALDVIHIFGKKDEKTTTASTHTPVGDDGAASVMTTASAHTPVGDVITFGAYEQDNNTSNGKEPIKWLVLEKQGNKALVISKYALDCQPYDTSYTDVTWEACTLRTWLNGEFLQSAFSTSEQARIRTATVTADKNPSYDTDPGSDTQDKVFLLSITEANKYFASDTDRRCAPTAYAIAQGADTSDYYSTSEGKAACWWWLRSPGYFSNYAAYVVIDGSVYYFGDYVDKDYGAVRPAFWINLES